MSDSSQWALSYDEPCYRVDYRPHQSAMRPERKYSPRHERRPRGADFNRAHRRSGKRLGV